MKKYCDDVCLTYVKSLSYNKGTNEFKDGGLLKIDVHKSHNVERIIDGLKSLC